MLLVPIILLSFKFCKSFFDFFAKAGQIRHFGQIHCHHLWQSATWPMTKNRIGAQRDRRHEAFGYGLFPSFPHNQNSLLYYKYIPYFLLSPFLRFSSCTIHFANWSYRPLCFSWLFSPLCYTIQKNGYIDRKKRFIEKFEKLYITYSNEWRHSYHNNNSLQMCRALYWIGNQDMNITICLNLCKFILLLN